MRSWFAPARVTEGTAEQVVSSGGMLGTWGRDPVDGDTGFRVAGRAGREVPYWTLEKARAYSVTAYRSNPMATAVVDTIVSFCVGDSGVTWQATNPDVAEVVREFWDDPAVRLGHIQEMSLRSTILLGEKLYELMEARGSGVLRFAPIDPSHIKDVLIRGGNPLWPSKVILPGLEEDAADREFAVAAVNDKTGLREGKCVFWAPWKTLDTDIRGMPFLTPILDWLDNYDQVLSNLIDRTSLLRHVAYQVKLTGAKQPDVDAFIRNRGGRHMPESGTIEVTNETAEWVPISGQTGAAEDTQANAAVLTNIAAGPGLAKTWLAEPDGANRATSLSMAEPVRRRVGSVQNVWLYLQTELVRLAVDRAVAAKRLAPSVEATDPRTGATMRIPASQAVIVTGPEIAAADSAIAAQVLLNLATGLEKLVMSGALSKDAAQLAAQKGWEEYMGVPFVAELGRPDASPADVQTEVERAQEAGLRVVGGRR